MKKTKMKKVQNKFQIRRQKEFKITTYMIFGVLNNIRNLS